MAVNNSVNNIFKTQPVTSVTAATYTVLATDVIIDVNFAGAVAVTLPTGSANNKGKFYVIKDLSGAASANNITVSAASGNVENGASTVISSNFGSAQVYSDGAN